MTQWYLSLIGIEGLFCVGKSFFFWKKYFSNVLKFFYFWMSFELFSYSFVLAAKYSDMFYFFLEKNEFKISFHFVRSIYVVDYCNMCIMSVSLAICNLWWNYLGQKEQLIIMCNYSDANCESLTSLGLEININCSTDLFMKSPHL